MRRQIPETESLRLSEVVNVGDEISLAERISLAPNKICDSNENGSGTPREGDEGDPATELADRLVQDWTNLAKDGETRRWSTVSSVMRNDAEPQITNEVCSSRVLIEEYCGLDLPDLRAPPSCPVPSELDPPDLKLPPPSVSATVPRVLMANLEYTMDAYAINCKVGHVGVVTQQLARYVPPDCLTRVVPRLPAIEYPDTMTESEGFRIHILDARMDIRVFSIKSNGIQYILLDCNEIFKDRARLRPYPEDMASEASAQFYSFWNQAVAVIIERCSPDVYHMVDFSSTLAPYYLKECHVPSCLTISSIYGQGNWSLVDDVQSGTNWQEVFGLDGVVYKMICEGQSHFNLLRAATLYLDQHQAGYGTTILKLPGTWKKDPPEIIASHRRKRSKSRNKWSDMFGNLKPAPSHAEGSAKVSEPLDNDFKRLEAK